MTNRIAKTCLAALIVLAGGVVGCSESTTPGPASVPVEALPAAYASALCEAVDSCLGALAPVFIGADCETPYREALANGTLPLFEAAIARGSLVYDGAKVNACVDAIAASGCDALDGRTPTALCEEALRGTVALGGPCDLDAECVGDAVCVQGPACPGACTARGGPGRACTRNDECQGGLVCDSTTCTARPTEGQACEGPSAPNCAAGLICVGGTDARPGTCRTQASVFAAAAGATCDLAMGQLCAEGLSCVIESISGASAVQVCAARVAAGAACKGGVPSQCPIDQYCSARPLMGMTDGVCMALPVGGEPCGVELIGQRCASGHVCSSGTCRPVQANGGACGTDAECYGGDCTAGVCATPALCMP